MLDNREMVPLLSLDNLFNISRLKATWLIHQIPEPVTPFIKSLLNKKKTHEGWKVGGKDDRD